MRCKLCLRKGEIVKPHIIPEFMYVGTGVYDQKHRYRIEEIEAPGKSKFEYKQKGLRDRLLCKECETKISVWEIYARMMAYGPYGKHCADYTKKAGPIYGKYVLFSGVNYKKYKLFLLSILWRASVTKLDEFGDVSLGPHEESIRRMILEESPGNEDDYGCVIVAAILDDKLVEPFIIPPGRVRVKGHRCYRMFIGGLLYHFVVSKHNIPTEVRELFLNRSNEMRALTPKIEDMPFIVQKLFDVTHRRRSTGR